MFAFCWPKPSFKSFTILFTVAFLLRAGTFYFYIQHEQRYRQSDSPDYHYNALSVAAGLGMTKLDSGRPVFWRVPGYPWYLSNFYKAHGLKTLRFEDYEKAQKNSIWFQLFLCSFIPIIIFFLALTLTGSLSVSWLTAGISALHTGLILASTFLLTEGLALIFFYLFLLFFFKTFRAIGEQPNPYPWQKNMVLAALALGTATWIRPMGEFVSVASALLILLFAQDNLALKLRKIALFMLVFFATIAPWYMRNYALTGQLFYCPMFGLYLNVFTAPKVLRATEGIPLQQAWETLQRKASVNAMRAAQAQNNSGKQLVFERLAGDISWPIVLAHPFIAGYEWIKEVVKTTFDLYAFQLVAIATKIHTWDPLEEFLTEKMAACLYAGSIPLWVRMLAWIELFFALFIWFSIGAGIWRFWIVPMTKKFAVDAQTKALAGLWLKLLFFVGCIVFMTGGFGYARLRLPAEPLMILLALYYWLRTK